MTLASQAADLLAAQGGERVDPPMILPAAVPLELSGEAVRSRICTFVDAQSKEWALRPDLTLPVALLEVARRKDGATGETLSHYRGRVFRMPATPEDPIEYEQIGFEKFGAPRSTDQDVGLFSTLSEACTSLGIKTASVQVGDLSVFPAFVDALGFPDDVAAGLKRAFRQAGGVDAYLAGLERNRSGLAGRVAGMSKAEIGAFVEDIFAITGVHPVGERRADEIVDRLAERSKSGASFEITSEQQSVLQAVLALDAPLNEATSALQRIATEHELTDLSDTLSLFGARAEQLSDACASRFGANPTFATQFGRRFTYYDGLVFEFAANDNDDARRRPFVAGGRYDSLLSDLSEGNVDATALGGIIIPHRMAPHLGAGS
jgi:ATP phosphoribosyltransferase regulatory subunit